MDPLMHLTPENSWPLGSVDRPCNRRGLPRRSGPAAPLSRTDLIRMRPPGFWEALHFHMRAAFAQTASFLFRITAMNSIAYR